MTLNFIPRDAVKSGETGTVAFLTPKRLGPATVRNQLRRRMREIYRRHLAQPDAPTTSSGSPARPRSNCPSRN